MVCPCILPVVATGTMGGAVLFRKEKIVLYIFTFLSIVLILMWWFNQNYKKRK